MTSTLIVGALVLIVAASLTVLLVPVRIRVDITTADSAARLVRTRIRWLFVQWDSQRARSGRPDSAPSKADTAADAPEAPHRTRGGAGGSRRAWALLRTAGFPSRVLRFVQRVLHVVRPRRVHVRARVGLEDPASTGELFGVLNGLAAVRSGTGPAWHVRVEPDFVEPVFDVRGTVEWSVSAGAVLWPVAALAASPVTWRALYAAWRA